MSRSGNHKPSVQMCRAVFLMFGFPSRRFIFIIKYVAKFVHVTDSEILWEWKSQVCTAGERITPAASSRVWLRSSRGFAALYTVSVDQHVTL